MPTIIPRRLRAGLAGAPVLAAMAIVLAGCGGHHTQSQPAGASATHATSTAGASATHTTSSAGASPTHATSTAAPAAGKIPQHNGGDMDSDNNGGPSDGDGGI